MSIKLPKYSIQESQNKPVFINKALPYIFLIVGLLIGSMTAYLLNDKSSKNIIERNNVLEESKEKDKNMINELNVQISQLSAENQVKNQAILQLQNDYKNQITTLNGLQSDIGFYQQLLSPSAENKGLRVFDSKINQVNELDYSLEFNLVQKIQKAKIISGRYEAQILGTLNNEKKTISVETKEDSKYEFKYFQKVSLGFSLPKGFKAEQLVVKLFPQNKKSQVIEYSTSWAPINQ